MIIKCKGGKNETENAWKLEDKKKQYLVLLTVSVSTAAGTKFPARRRLCMRQSYRAQTHDKMHTQYVGQTEKILEKISRDIWGADNGVRED
jgi:hypothetical protein